MWLQRLDRESWHSAKHLELAIPGSQGQATVCKHSFYYFGVLACAGSGFIVVVANMLGYFQLWKVLTFG